MWEETKNVLYSEDACYSSVQRFFTPLPVGNMNIKMLMCCFV